MGGASMAPIWATLSEAWAMTWFRGSRAAMVEFEDVDMVLREFTRPCRGVDGLCWVQKGMRGWLEAGWEGVDLKWTNQDLMMSHPWHTVPRKGSHVERFNAYDTYSQTSTNRIALNIHYLDHFPMHGSPAVRCQTCAIEPQIWYYKVGTRSD